MTKTSNFSKILKDYKINLKVVSNKKENFNSLAAYVESLEKIYTNNFEIVEETEINNQWYYVLSCEGRDTFNKKSLHSILNKCEIKLVEKKCWNHLFITSKQEKSRLELSNIIETLENAKLTQLIIEDEEENAFIDGEFYYHLHYECFK